MIGTLLADRYEVLSLLGQGGMGAVYRARHTGTGKVVALKVILGADMSKHKDVVARFQREARAAGAIDTQHIVHVIDSGVDRERGFPFMVMELLKGEDVQQLIQRVGVLAPDLAMRITAQACIGLSKAHEASVVHRDIKPANLFLARRDGGEVVVKLLDFGIAKVKMDELATSDGHGLTKTGSMLGSPLYMSPEQAKGLKTIDARTDLWSMGAVLYEALTGHTPHHHADTLGQLILAICSEPPRPVQDVSPWVPPEVAAIAGRALTIDVDRRYGSAKEMLAALEALLPGGTSLHEDMLVGASEDAKRFSAPRLTGPDAWGPTAVAVSGDPPSASTGQGGLARSGVEQTVSRGRSRAGIAAVVALVAAAGTVGVWKFRPSANNPGEAIGASKSSDVASPAAAASGAPVLTTWLTVAPPTAEVEVDGAPARVEDGRVQLTGALGSVHRVRLRVGSVESTSDVVIAESGTVPARLQVETTSATSPKRPANAGPPPGPAPPKTAPSPSPATTTPPVPVKPKGGLDRDFDK